MIGFNIPISLQKGMDYMKDAIGKEKISGDGYYTKKCNEWMQSQFHLNHVFLTTSCTTAIEMAAVLCDIKDGDEVIMPSFTFVSTANAFVMHGAKIVFVDINPKTMTIDENLIEQAITNKTKAIVPVCYAGVSADMDKIMEIGKKHNIKIVEDAAQGVMAKYKGRYIGNNADISCYSFHETKNYIMGEGGALVFNDNSYAEQSEIMREKGTNRTRFLLGQVDKYTWVDKGASYLPSDLNAAYLYSQLEMAKEINDNRLKSWNFYHSAFECLEAVEGVNRPYVPEYCEHNGHMYYLKAKDLEERTKLIDYLKENGIQAVFHYVPLHSSPGGQKFSRFSGEDNYTTKESQRLVRLPLYYGLKEEDAQKVVDAVKKFYKV